MVGYSLYCEDNNDFYPGVRESDGLIRKLAYSYEYDLGKQIGPYFSGGDSLEFSNQAFSKYVGAFQCPYALDYTMTYNNPDENKQNNLPAGRYKKFFALMFNISKTWSTTNEHHSYLGPERMARLGDTWRLVKRGRPNNGKIQSDYGPWKNGAVFNQDFNIVAMDAIQAKHEPAKNKGLYSNHFWNDPYFEPFISWGEVNRHFSLFGEAVVNFVLDDGSTTTLRASLIDMYAEGENGWNRYSESDTVPIPIPRSLAVEK